jgi:hypothetical protein
LDIRHSNLIRHSNFVIRHSSAAVLVICFFWNSMIQISANWAALLALSVMTSAGCVKTHPTLPPPPRPNPAPQVASDPAVRVQTLTRLADTYARTSNALPGGSAAEHRQLMAQVFSQLQEILPILEGPDPGAEFRQQLQVVRDAQGELSSGPQDLSPEPTIDTGLRAARDALSGIAQSGFYDRGTLTPLFDQLATKINELDTVRGPWHQVVAGEAVGLTSRIVTSMADALSQILAQQKPTREPAPEPATAPVEPQAATPPAQK